MATVLMIIAPERFRDEELFETQAELLQAGHRTVIASTRNGPCTGSRGGQAVAEVALEQVHAADYDAVVFVGGGGSKLLFDNQAAWQIAQEAAHHERVLAAICLAPVILARAGVLADKNATVAGTEAKTIEDHGAHYTGPGVTVDGKLITANGPKSARLFGQQICTVLAKTARVGDMQPVQIVPYQAGWPAEFREIATNLRGALGPLALRIDHIGSTSVPGLPAKNVIDIQVSVAALDDRLVTAMQAVGYTQPEGIWRDHCPPGFVEPDSKWQKFFFRPPPGQRPTNTHVRVLGRANQRYPLLFRDYLRTHPATAEAYAELKRRLAHHLADPQMYPLVKDPAVDLIYFAAEDWAAVTGWQPGAADA